MAAQVLKIIFPIDDLPSLYCRARELLDPPVTQYIIEFFKHIGYTETGSWQYCFIFNMIFSLYKFE